MKKKMDQCETWAKDYLIYRGFKGEDVKFIGDRNVPPDFLVEDRIAVEVRRLNQHWQALSGEREPVEKLSMPLFKRLKRLLDSFGPPRNGVSWYVINSFQRPQLTRDWEPILRDKLEHFANGEIQDDEKVICIDEHFNVRLIRKSKPGASMFIWGASSDFNEGGFVIEELEKSVRICIAEKSSKIANYRSKYQEWWLVLVDYMFGGTAEALDVEHNWDKVLIIHPSDYGRAYEVLSSRSASQML